MNRFFFLQLGVVLVLPQLAWSQSTASAGFAPSAQTVQGVTVRLTHAQWQPMTTVLGRAPGVFIPDQVLVVSGTVSGGPAVPLPVGSTEMDYVTASVIGPQGEKLHGLPLRDGSGWYFAGLDPRWNTAHIEIEHHDPAAARGAAFGNFPGIATFSQIAVPLLNGPPVTVGQTQTTVHGTRITLEKIRLRQINFTTETSNQMQLLLTWEPSAAQPDTRVRFTLDGQVQADNGDIIGSVQGDGSESNTLDSYRDRRAAKYTGTPFTLNLHLTKPPAANVKTLTISANYWEVAPSLRSEAAFTHFLFPLALKSVTAPSHTSHQTPVVSRKQGDLLAVVEDVRPQYNQEMVRLWLHDALPQNRERSWWIAQASVQDPKTGQQQSVFLPSTQSRGRGGPPMPDYRLFWKSNGEPLGPTDAGYRVEFSPSQFSNHPASVTLSLALELRHQMRYAFDLPNLPVPPAGAPLRVNSRAMVSGLGTFEAVAITLFDPVHPLQTRLGNAINAGQGHSGMALVLKYTPERADAMPPVGSLLLDEMTTRDLPGSVHSREEVATPIWADVVDQETGPRSAQTASPPTYFVTLPLLPAPAGKTVFTLHLAFDQVLVSDRQGVALTIPVVYPHPGS